MAERGDPRGLREALGIVQAVWERDISNLELRDWVAYLHAKTDNPKAAEPILEHIRKRREVRENFSTIWNLAVLAYDRKDESSAYELILPLLDGGALDEDLILVVLALSIKLNDRERFLEIIPRTLSLKFHPLGVVLAHDIGDKLREGELLTQLLRQSEQKWELPPVGERFSSFDGFRQTVNKAIVEGQIDQLISWLEARIGVSQGWIPNYLALARVYEEEKQDIDSAFRVLTSRLMQARSKQRDQERVDEACRDLLELCRRAGRQDLGQQAFVLALSAKASRDLLDSFRSFAPESPELEISPKVEMKLTNDVLKSDNRSPIGSRDPKLAERLAWVTARLASIRNVDTYVQEMQAVIEFGKIMAEMSPQESGSVVKIIRDLSEVIEIFKRTESDDHDTRRVLYDRTTAYEMRLADLLSGGALSRSLADVLTPYHIALKKVVGDLSRQAGIGPNIEVAVENAFFSLDSEKSTLALRITNASERSASDVLIELLLDSPSISVVGKRERRLASLDSRKSVILSFPVECIRSRPTEREVSIGISLRASAEGFPNMDLGITKRSLPIKTLEEVIGSSQIPKLFQSGNPLKPTEPDLFQGRNDIIAKLANSFYGGVQRERFFLDGIRRVGKTSILNFIPLHLPDNVFPVPVNLDKFGLRGAASSATILQQFCELIKASSLELAGVDVGLPAREEFESNPGHAFARFLSSLKLALPGRAPFIMVDEFQELLQAVARTGSGRDRDTLVLDQIRGHSDEGSLYMVFTGSVRFDRLSGIVDHRIFGSLTRLRVSFLPEASVNDVLRAGFARWANIPPETVRRVYELTGGYPWLVQTYGAGLVDLLNREQRAVATPEDVDFVTNDAVLCNDELFSHWWPSDQLGIEEERFVEWLFRHYQSDQVISVRDFFSSIHNRDLQSFRRAFENLRACEVLDSTQTEILRFSGVILRRWLEQKIQDGQLKVRPPVRVEEERGFVGMFVDHENLIKSLERISRARGVDFRPDRLAWFYKILVNMVSEAEKRLGALRFRVAVAFWERPHEASLLPAYFKAGFIPAAPEPVKMANAVDFKVASEVRRANEQALREGKRLGRAIIVTGDGDLSHEARSLVNDGVSVQVWGGSRETNEVYRDIVGEGNVIVLDDVSGL